MKESYTQAELDQVLCRVQKRSGWDFSRMNDSRAPVPWDYHEVVLRYLTRQLCSTSERVEAVVPRVSRLLRRWSLVWILILRWLSVPVRMGKIRRMWSLLSQRKPWTECREPSMSLSTATRHLIRLRYIIILQLAATT